MRIYTNGFEDGGEFYPGDIYTGTGYYMGNRNYAAPWGFGRCIEVCNHWSGFFHARQYLLQLHDMSRTGTGDFSDVYIRLYVCRCYHDDDYNGIRIWDENQNEICSLYTNGQLYVMGVADSISSPIPVFSTDFDWRRADFRIKMAINGYVIMRIDGNVVYTKFTDTTALGGSVVGYVGGRIAQVSYPNGYGIWFDDIAVNDVQGADNNSWLPDARIIGLVPIANGSYNQWTPFPGTGESNYEDVNEVPQTADTSYVLAASGGLRDAYNRDTLASLIGGGPYAVHMVTPVTIAKLSAADTNTYRAIAKKGITTQVGPTHSPTATYNRFGWCMDKAPDSSAWDEDTLSDTEFGMDSL